MKKISVSVAKISEALVQNFEKEKLGIELSYFSYPENVSDEGLCREALKRHQELLSGFGQELSMHGAFYDLNPTARDPWLVDVCERRVKQSIEIAWELGIQKLVFHPNFFPSTKSGYLDTWKKKQTAFWESIAKFIENTGTKLLLENTREEAPHYIADIVKELPRKHFGICYDSGHSHCFTEAKLAPKNWVQEYGNLLEYIHLHANNGSTDQHICFRDGNIDFSDFFESLSPDVLMVIEVINEKEFLKSLPLLREVWH